MRGSTRKRGQTWTALWDHHDPATGQRRQKSKGGFRTQREAQTHLAKVVTAIGEGGYSEPSKQPLGEFLRDEWLPAVRNTVRILTATSYEDNVRGYLLPADIAGVPLRSLSPGHVNALLDQLERQGLSVGTRRLIHAVLRRALNDAVRWGKLARNPVPLVKPPAAERGKARAWTESELRRFLEHVEHDRLFALYRVGATTGMRRGELLGLTWLNTDLDGGRLTIAQQLLPIPGGVMFGPPKSKRSERTIVIDAETVEALRRHRDAQRLERDLAADAYEDRDLVFADELGRPIHPQQASVWFRKHRKAAGIPTGSLHVLRHTATTIALVSGVPLHVVAARLGDDPNTMLAVYAHLLPQSDAAAAEALASALAPRSR